jgi:hypothetical protein
MLGGLVAPDAVRADDAAELRALISGLARTSYTWETTVRRKFGGTTTAPRFDASAAVETRGEFDAAGFTFVTLPPTRDVPVAITALTRHGDAVVLTPTGWLRRDALREAGGGEAERDLAVEGKTVRRTRFVAAALKAMAVRPVVEELLDLMVEFKAVRREQGLYLAELPERAIEQAWGGPESKRAPEVHGTVIFKVGEAGIAEYHVVLGIGFPDTRTKGVAWTLQQWSTRFSAVGATTVAVPEGALQALDK